MTATPFRRFFALFFLSAAPLAWAHPLPEIPVRTDFDGAGGCVVTVEIDPRSCEADPNTAPSLTKADYDLTPEPQREALKKKASEYIHRVLKWSFEGAGAFAPELAFAFSAPDGKPLQFPDEVVVLHGVWTGKTPAGSKGYAMSATKEGSLSVVIHHTAKGMPVERFAVLFPGETSYTLDMTTWLPRTAAPAPITAKE
ncbi:MAG: hypothetical protein IPK32_16225 [Verrucomicrobiaceae bacterium]|nr:hypothetical protein [Verrucomicrobiaceae bacterium]